MVMYLLAEWFRVRSSTLPTSSDQSRLDVPPDMQRFLDANRPYWLLWQTGMEVRAFTDRTTTLLSLKQYLPLAEMHDLDYSRLEWMCRQDDGIWCC